jgi:hypothetical protein
MDKFDVVNTEYYIRNERVKYLSLIRTEYSLVIQIQYIPNIKPASE